MSHFIYWSKKCPLYLLVEKVSVDNMSVENMSVKKTSWCHFVYTYWCCNEKISESTSRGFQTTESLNRHTEDFRSGDEMLIYVM